MIARRLITIPTLFLTTALATVLLPLLLLAAWLLTLLPATRGALATMGFLIGYLWCETVGVLVSAYLWLRHRDRQAFLEGNYALQRWWTMKLKSLAELLFRLDFRISGHAALEGPAAIVIPRHASIADTVIPMACYAIPRQLKMRYILKRELLFDPCLDIVGNRLPNLFVDRGGQDSQAAREAVAGLMADIGSDEGALIYPEGTRYSERKRDAMLEKAGGNSELRDQLRRWPLLLPPRLGGTLAMLQANPGKDVVFCAHVGFEGSTHFSNLINGGWLAAAIEIEFWRVPYERIPKDVEGLKQFLFENWDRMHEWIAARQPQTSF